MKTFLLVLLAGGALFAQGPKFPVFPSSGGGVAGDFSGLSGVATDAQIPNNITIDLAALASALAANGANCSAGQAAGGVSAAGASENCIDLAATYLTIATAASTYAPLASPTFTGTVTGTFSGNLTGNVTGNAATATALAANGANCSAGQFPLGVNAAGAVETCTALPTTITGTANQITASASTGAITLSIPTNPTLPGNTTGTFIGNVTGTASGNQPLDAQLTDIAALAVTDDAVLVANGSNWQLKVIGDCDNATTSKLLYDATTNAFSCGTDQNSGGGSGIANVSALVVSGTSVTVTHNASLSDPYGFTFGCIDEDTAVEYPPLSLSTVTANAVTFNFSGTVTNVRCTVNTSGAGGTGTVTHTAGALTSDLPMFGAGSADSKVGTKTGTGTEAVMSQSPTIVTPTIASFANAAHNHTNAAGGAQITDAALSAAVTVAKGGTGLTAGTSGGVPYYSSTSAMTSSAALTANLPVIGGGAGAAPAVGTRSGNTTAFVTTTGTQTSGRCVEIDASGNHIAAAAACGSGAGGTISTQLDSGTVQTTDTLKIVTGTGMSITESFTSGDHTLTFNATGGGSGTVTHTAGALTADLPMFGNGSADSKVGTKTGTGTEAVMSQSPTIVTPTVASFANAAHNHTNAAGGAQLTDAALSSAVTVAKGGTGIASGTSGGIPYYSGTTTIASSGALTANLPVFGGGAGASPIVGTRSGNTTQVVTTTGTQTNGRCVEIDASGNHVASVSACNSLTISFPISFVAAVCQNATASLGFSTPVSNPAVAACVTGTNTQFGVAQFADGANTLSMQGHLPLPSDWTGAIDWKGRWRTSATTGSVVWQIQTACVANAETSDPSWNTASTVTDAALGTTVQQNEFSTTGITATGCAAGEEFYFRILRDPTNGSDDLAATAELISTTITIRRAI